MQNINLAKILFIGCGKMGGVLLNNLLQNGAIESQTKIVDPAFAGADFSGVKTFAKISDLPNDFVADLIFLCIKPQNCEQIIADLVKSSSINKNSVIISILAGKNLKFLRLLFGQKAKIVRMMPNLPIQENEGVVAYHLNQNLKNDEVLIIQEIFKNFGEIVELKDEKKFDAFTAIFGSGPAYIFYLEEIFAQIALENGFDENAAKLVQKLFLGSVKMSQNGDFENLRKNVTSKEGTTEAALQVLQKNDGLKKIFKKAVNAAIKRSKELSK